MHPTYRDIIKTVPSRFRSEKAGAYSTVFHFDISGEGGGQHTVTIHNGKCVVEEGLSGEPKCTIRAEANNYVNIEIGKTNPQMALMTGKVKVSNISEMMKFSKMFYRFRPENLSGQTSQPVAERKPQQGPLKGLRVLDFTRLLPGPLATMMMADMGAEVIKVEDPSDPDYIRSFPPFVGNESALYQSLNRSKRSLSINFGTEEGREIIHSLAKTADILVEQYRPGVMENLQLGYADLQKSNPRIIYVSITGYGQDGPYARKAGHDLNYIGYSGLLGLTGEKDGNPVIPGGQVADVAGGSYMAINACLTALYAREKTGEGQHVDVSMMDGVMPLNTLQIAQYFATLENLERGNLQLSGGIANYNVYRCADGKHIALGTLEPKFWEPFCDAVNHPEWKQRILDSGEDMNELKSEVAALFETQTKREWLELLEAKNICISPVLSISELEKDQQVQHRNMIIEQIIEGQPFKSPGIPLKFSKTVPKISWNAPALGEDTHALLTELGFSEERIAQLRDQGILSV